MSNGVASRQRIENTIDLLVDGRVERTRFTFLVGEELKHRTIFNQAAETVACVDGVLEDIDVPAVDLAEVSVKRCV